MPPRLFVSGASQYLAHTRITLFLFSSESVKKGMCAEVPLAQRPTCSALPSAPHLGCSTRTHTPNGLLRASLQVRACPPPPVLNSPGKSKCKHSKGAESISAERRRGGPPDREAICTSPISTQN